MSEQSKSSAGNSKQPSDGAPSEPLTELKYDYIKSNLFRVIHADGLAAALTPQLNFFVHFWSERYPIPRRVVHRFDPDGSLGDEILERREYRDAIIREVESAVVLDYEGAVKLRDWLNELIEDCDKILTKSDLGDTP